VRPPHDLHRGALGNAEQEEPRMLLAPAVIISLQATPVLGWMVP
jgi:hypothetical protein